ncbi:choline/carnitine O-acyltransferase [Nocardia brasiliensis]|uniref:Putative carnitine O-acetyltransferase (Carnitine acetylase) (CAT) (Carnitine acetyltransferase) (CrAT) n=1 Tax=Nocardia brasiliensis (strain ATCC 700358 / HUJEG-1) TaxID=1133849 RepID=K0F2K9_NOCB7|nr:choline/carnitine O-acyltransferase [Nocardia brasiliensis]AFU03360.1 putative carnitine O-acetyltransferase (Carnitine acetylase) (CAT) (Carnitine acetyltransferase) (CrAT) [Nocardia brasiliensis ATCC 700358]OCF85247.1 carnitine O-acetyltransferase [Nocardia brasiliensis]
MTERTFAADDTLPRVPLPTLEASCHRFLEWCAPLLTADELATTEAAVADLLRPGSPARTLHAALAEYDATPGVGSWLDLFWPSRYLGRRDRIALNANFFFLFREETTLATSTGANQVERAAGIISAAVDYKLALDQEAIPPVLQRGQALSMWQNKYLFSETRIPGAEQDSVRVPYSAEWPGPSTAKHVVVFFRGSMFRMDVLGADGVPYSLDDLADGLREVLKAGARSTRTDSAVGHLTTKARGEWAASRQSLLAEPANAAALDTVETALFCVCLEDFAPRDELHACDQLLHGDSANRWFDKSVSFIVFGDGQAGINIEHCGLDGTTILSFVDAMLETSAQEHATRSGAQAQGLPAVEPIEFVLDAAQRNDIAAAGADFARYAADNATQTVSFTDFGTTRAKQLGISPDAFAQLSYQLAHRRSKGITGATYESIATRQYRNGRTEAMRVITPEMVAFVDAMQDESADRDARLAAARTAATAHVTRAKQCQAGDAPEQHLWELQWIQRRRGAELGVTEPIPLFDSPGWTIMRDDYLSTSSAPSVNIRYFGFGSTSPRCIGVAYVLLPDRWNLYLATPTAVADQMHAFADHLRTAVADLEALLSPS